MKTGFPYQQTKSLMLEWIRDHPAGQFSEMANGVAWLAIKKQLVTPNHMALQLPDDPVHGCKMLPPVAAKNVKELVRQLMWDLLTEKVIVFGMDEHNPHWPWYRVTGYGEKVAAGHGPQPYDPNGFMAAFTKDNPTADPVIVDYVNEAIRCFNHSCDRAAAVMLGAASEKAVLLLFDVFASAIEDEKRSKRFVEDGGKLISRKFDTLQRRLVQITSQDELSSELRRVKETLDGFLGPLFHLIRAYRNQAGHPEMPGHVERDTVFVNLRVFTEYIRRVYQLIDYFSQNKVTW